MDKISIPRVQVSTIDSRVINQLQSNFITGFNRLQQGLTGVTSSIGDIQLSPLTLAQFQAQRGNGWVLSDGQTVKGSMYEELTGNSAVPNQVANFTGVSPYIRIN